MNLITRHKKYMGTIITIKVVRSKMATVKILDAIEEAFEEFERIVKLYTRFEETSELSRLNKNSGSWQKISKEFFMLLNFMLELAQKTEGAFDPTIIDFLEVYGYDKNYDFSRLDNPELDNFIKHISQKRHSWKKIRLDRKNSKVKLAEGQRIDLGGIGKGYAIDCAYKKLHRLKNTSFLIDAGGDIRVYGKNEKEKVWNVGLKYKQDKNLIPNYKLLDSVKLKSSFALAGSGSWARRIKQFHHIIDPSTGKPADQSYSTVFVVAPTAMEADAWATAIFVGGKKLLGKIPDNLKILIN